MQKNWIGKSYGCEINFKLMAQTKSTQSNVILLDPILFWFSFLALSIDHPISKYYEKDESFQEFKRECAKTGTTEEAIAVASKNWI